MITTHEIKSLFKNSNTITRLDTMYYILNMNLPLKRRINLRGFKNAYHHKLLPIDNKSTFTYKLGRIPSLSRRLSLHIISKKEIS